MRLVFVYLADPRGTVGSTRGDDLDEDRVDARVAEQGLEVGRERLVRSRDGRRPAHGPHGVSHRAEGVRAGRVRAFAAGVLDDRIVVRLGGGIERRLQIASKAVLPNTAGAVTTNPPASLYSSQL